MTRGAAWTGGALAAAIAVAGLHRYPGSTAVYLFFNLCIAALVIAAFPRPRLYGYIALALFLVMGLWTKTMVHTFWRVDFLEPVGAFAGAESDWDRALLAICAAAAGVVAVRLLHLWYRRRKEIPETSPIPGWFLRHRRAVWSATVIGLVAVNVANLEFAFYQIGVNPKLLLPLRLHVLASWLVNIGGALWIAALAWWDHQAGRHTLATAFVEAFISSASAFSRLSYLVHAAPYWLVLLDRRRQLGIGNRWLGILAAAFILLFVASLYAVFWLRATHYPANADLRHNLRSEVPQLVVQRWTGLEGVLAVTSAGQGNFELLRRAITESPRGGVNSVYAQAAKPRYSDDATRRYTFGSNVGPVALLLFSGSLAAVFAGMAVLAGSLVLTEELARRWTGNPFLVAVAGTALASVLSQTTFFYLTMIFFLQLWLAIAVLAVVARVGRSD